MFFQSPDKTSSQLQNLKNNIKDLLSMNKPESKNYKFKVTNNWNKKRKRRKNKTDQLKSLMMLIKQLKLCKTILKLKKEQPRNLLIWEEMRKLMINTTFKRHKIMMILTLTKRMKRVTKMMLQTF